MLYYAKLVVATASALAPSLPACITHFERSNMILGWQGKVCNNKTTFVMHSSGSQSFRLKTFVQCMDCHVTVLLRQATPNTDLWALLEVTTSRQTLS